MNKTFANFVDPETYFDELGRWLDLEAVAERERMARRRMLRAQKDAEKSGETLLGMSLADHRTGLAGRFLLDFKKADHQELPNNRLKVGSPVVISDHSSQSDHGISGVVSAKNRQVIQVATEEWPEGFRHRIDLSPDETTRRRQLAAMARARVASGRALKLRDTILGKRPASCHSKMMQSLVLRSDLNPPQESAVKFALSVQDIGVIHGPPGTGKTTTIAELIYQSVKQGKSVLACAPSNTAVDNLLEKLIGLRCKAVRIGHPARVFRDLRQHTLDELVDLDPSTRVIKEMRREVQQLVRAAQNASRGKDWRRRKRQYFSEAGQLRSQIRSLEKSVIQSVIDSAEVVCTTTTIDDDLLGDRHFDLVVIDEACQATIPGTWQSVLRAEKLILAGDHQQLPPTVLSRDAADAGMQRSLLQELVERDGESIYRRLTVQYRMNEAIMNFSSERFYDSQLLADRSVASHQLADFPQIVDNDLTQKPLLFIDTAGAEYEESLEEGGESKLNLREAQLTSQVILKLIEYGTTPSDIAVIAPYAAQVRALRHLIGTTGCEIDTVDGFQGQEKEVVVLTMVRSNEHRQIGFLADIRRTNVAITRARRKLIMIGDSATLGSNDFYADLLDYFEQQQSYSTVWQEDF